MVMRCIIVFGCLLCFATPPLLWWRKCFLSGRVIIAAFRCIDTARGWLDVAGLKHNLWFGIVSIAAYIAVLKKRRKVCNLALIAVSDTRKKGALAPYTLHRHAAMISDDAQKLVRKQLHDADQAIRRAGKHSVGIERAHSIDTRWIARKPIDVVKESAIRRP